VNEIQRYILEEHVEDFEDGLIGRRELLRRVTLITGSVAATMSVLAVLGCNLEQPRGAGSHGPVSTTSSPNVPYATPPPSPVTGGITVRADDPRISAQNATVKASDGADLMGYLARPRGDGRYAGVLVIQENRGVLEHIRDVVRRVATAGFAAITVDLLSRQGGADRLGDTYPAELGKRSAEDLLKDLRSALDHMKTQSYVDAARIGVVGFCFGGGQVWNLVASGADLKAAVPFYGPAPSNPSALAATKTAVLGIYAEQDTRITGSAPSLEAELKKSGTTYRLVTYPGVNHAFHNDTGQRYNAAEAQQAWVETIEWFRRHLS
jgi:carboxymethylenebutenolidase